MKYILFPVFLVFSFGTLLAQDAPAPAAAEAEPAPAAAEDEARWSDFLPLNKEMAGDADLPLPLGIGVTIYNQDQDLKSKSISLAVPIMFIDHGVISAENAKVASEVDSKSLRLDAWVLPFLNVYGVVGDVDGKNTVAPGLDIVGAPAALAALEAGIEASGFTLDYNGDFHGFGAVLAGQMGEYWGTIDYNFTETDLDISSSEIETHTITPRIGRSGTLGNAKGSLWIGAMRQKIDEDFNGEMTFGGLDIGYKVKNEQEDEWNFLVGGSIELDEQADFALEAGFGDREQLMGSLTIRF